MTWRCAICGAAAAELPLCFSAEAPWRELVPESEFAARVDLTPDQCVVDERSFFVRGHIEVPVLGQAQPLAFSVWSSLSEKSFTHMSERWFAPDRMQDEPCFGWLSSAIPAYPDTVNQRLSVQSRAVGLTPIFTLEPSPHPLSLEQKHGITVARWQELAHLLLHDGV